MSTQSLTQSQLKEILHYNPDTGVFTRLMNGNFGRWKIGDIAGCVSSESGYVLIRVLGVLQRAHRLAFLYMTGSFPQDQVDHEDHIRHNNEWLNIRQCTNQENHKNESLSKNNTSGNIGVSFNRGKWCAYIMVDRKKQHLGRFITKQEAICARKSADIEYNFHTNHGKTT